MIPLSVPNLAGNEWTYVKDCLDTGWISSVGSYVNRFEESVAEFTGSKYGVATMNGTAALHLALQLVGVKASDAVIVPNITFVASCNAVKYLGAFPLLVDVDVNTWQMDLNLLEEWLQTKTEIRDNGPDLNGASSYIKGTNQRIGAILPVHVLGNMCDMDQLVALATKYCLPIVEDSTEALGSTFRSKHAGTFGAIGTFSFNGNKIISTGGGGLLVTDDEDTAKKAKHLTTQAKTDPFEYHHDHVGYNYRLVNVLAAIGLAQMELLPTFLEIKKSVDAAYKEGLSHFDVRFQFVQGDVSPNNWLQTIWVNDQRRFIEHLLQNEIQCRPFWVPMNQLPMFRDCTYIHFNDVSNAVYSHCVSIPSSTNLSEEDVNEVIRVVSTFQF